MSVLKTKKKKFMEKYFCQKCQKIFEAQGEKKEWKDKIYGECWKMIAFCPDCQSECDEYRSLNNSNSGCHCANCQGHCGCGC